MTAAHDIKTHAEINLKTMNNALKQMQMLTLNAIKAAILY